MRVELGRHGGSKNHTGWRLLTGSGPRTTDYAVRFKRPFRRRPDVHIGLCSEDVIDGANHRISVSVIGVGREGFLLRYHTWANTRVWSASVNYIAFARHGDDEEIEVEGDEYETLDFGNLGSDVSTENDPNEDPSD